ncbi:MAG: hypothetical protein H6867_03710 [Rhodospirillales bacterium]|nr:hypothetical protein [Rhodospirillales bacterium]MCB9996257.1 hypothetical protein [Rhodospirillales bacterium]
MAQQRKRPLIVVPGALKDWFVKASCGAADVVLFAEVRGIDPTMPGLDEFEDMIGGEDLWPEDVVGAGSVSRARPVLRLITLYGQRLDR